VTPGPDGDEDVHGGQIVGVNHELGVEVVVVEVVATGQTTDALASRMREPTTKLNTSRILVTVVRP